MSTALKQTSNNRIFTMDNNNKNKQIFKDYNMHKKLSALISSIAFIISIFIPITIAYWLCKPIYVHSWINHLLAQYTHKRIAFSALGRLMFFTWTLIVYQLWNYIYQRREAIHIFSRPYIKQCYYALIGFLIQCTLIAITFVTSSLLGWCSISLPNVHLQKVFIFMLASGFFFSLTVYAEELIFRGVILNRLAYAYQPYIACLLSALLFFCVHPAHAGGLYGAITQAFMGGFFLAYIAWYTQSIYVTFGIHLANNLLYNSAHALQIITYQNATNHSIFYASLTQHLYLALGFFAFCIFVFTYTCNSYKVKT